jgi:hypothetical protein
MTWFDKLLKEAWDQANEALKVIAQSPGTDHKVTQVTVTTTATKLPSTPLSGRKAIEIYNTSDTTIEIGPSTVTFGNGRPVKKDFPVAFDLTNDKDVYGITQTGSADVRVTEIA